MRMTFAELSLTTIRRLANIQELGVMPEYWNAMQSPLTEREYQQLSLIKTHLLNYQLNLMNEATIWSRAIYPMLLLAETKSIQAWAQVPLKALYPAFELEGIADGVLGNVVSGTIEAPYFIVVEAKRGLEAQNPQYQLYGSMLAAAWVNQQQAPRVKQEIYGCYTIGDNWTFVHGVVSNFNEDTPSLTVQFSREYAERLEAETVLQILKYIIQGIKSGDEVKAIEKS